MANANPGLARAVAEVTQPFGSPQSGDVLRSLQKYLQDKKSVDNVYKALVLRAWAEPLSQAVFDKVVNIFKQCLLRHTPSLDVLELLDEFCTALPRALPLPPSSMKAVQYAQACVCRAYDNCVAQAAASQQRPMTAEKRLSAMHDRPASAPRLPPRGRTPSLSNPPTKPPTPSLLSSMGAAAGSGMGFVGKQQQGGTGPQVLELHSRPSTAQTTRAAGLPGYGGGSGHLLRRSTCSLDSEAEAKLMTTPTWAVQGAATFVGLLDEGQQPVQVEGPVESSWLGYVPELNPCLTPAPYGEEPSLMLLDEESEQEGPGTTAPPASATCLARSILDVDEERVEEHLLEVALALKQEVQLDSETKAGTAPRPPSGRHHGKVAQSPPPPLVNSVHARMMFSHQPYSVQEELPMSQADVAVVVEVVCGAGAAKAFGAEAPYAGSAGAKPWSESFDEGDLGQVCGSILMKLVMDLFLNAGPGTSYPLVLRMLRQSLASPQPEIRARSFDVIFNLTLHSALLEPSDHAAAAHSDGEEQLHSGENHSQSQQQQDQHETQPQQQQQGQAEDEDKPPVQDQSTKHGQMMCWLRALCMQLLADITEADESSEEVWQAGLACFLVLITYKGHIVEQWAIHTPLNAMSGLLCACVMFGWSPDLHAQLIRLASTLLVKHEPDAAVLAKAAAAADRAVVEQWATRGGRHSRHQQQQPQQPKMKPRLGGVPEEFGGLQEVLRHMALAPTPAARADMLGVILHYLSPDESVMGALTQAIHTRGLTPLTAALQAAVACPRPGGLALRLASCLAGHVPYGPHGHGFPAGHARNHSQGRGLYFGGGAGFGFGHGGSSLVGAGSGPNPPTNSVVNNWLSMEAMRFNAGGVSHTGSLRGGHFRGPSTMSPNALPLPIAELLLAFLSSLEEAVVLPLQLCLKPPDVNTHITATLDHITCAGGGQPDPTSTAAAWEALKAACEEVEGLPSTAAAAAREGASSKAREGAGHSAYSSTAGRDAEGGDGVLGATTRRRRACAAMARLPASGGQLALHWLHQVLLQAFLVCQSAPLLMAPTTLRSPTSARQAGAGTFGNSSPSGGGGHKEQQSNSPRAPSHDTGAGARAAAAAAIAVRSASPGSVFGSPSPPPAANGGTGTIRSIGHHGGLRGGGVGTHTGGTPPPNGLALRGSGELQQQHSGGPPHEQHQQLASAWTCKLAGVLTFVVKEVPCGGRLLVAAMARVVSDLKQGISDLQARMQIVMAVHHVTLLWLLQSGSHGTSDRQAAIQELSDQVLHSLTQPLHSCDDTSHSRSSRSGTAGPGSHAAGSVPTSLAQQRQSFDDLPGSGGATLKPIRSHNLRVSCSDTASTTGDTSSTTLQLNPPFIHCHIAFAILTSQAGFVPDVLQATPPELLVGLLQHCVHPHWGGKGHARGFMGRTNPANAYASGAAQEFMVDGLQVHTLSQPPPTWGDVAMDRRLALLLALMACCGLDPDAFVKFGLSHVIRSGLMSSTDPRERYYAGVYLLRHLQLNQQDKYWRALRTLLLQAQQLNDERMIDNPYLTAASMLSIDGY